MRAKQGWYARNRHRYPPDWEEIARGVKDEAGWRCEACDNPHGPPPYILTVDHVVDHAPENVERSNLAALCQRCHLRRQGMRPAPRNKEEALRRLRRRYEEEQAQAQLPEGGVVMDVREAAPISPDAGRSALGYWTLGNPMVAWLLRRDAAVLAKTPAELWAGQTPPACPAGFSPHAMLWRPGWWKCWRHGEVMAVRQELEIERAPKGDVLTRLGEMLDYRWDPALREYVVAQVQATERSPKTEDMVE